MTGLNRIAAIVALSALSIPGTADDITPRHITVNGEGTVLVDPDRATINVGVEARASNLDSARQDVNDATSRFLRLCKKLGIAERFVNTSAANIRPEYSRNDQQRGRRLTGYFVSRTLTVDLRDLEQLGELLEGSVNLGINNVSSPVLGLVDATAATRQALKKATEDAKTNAEAIASTLSVQLGAVQYVNAGANNMPPVPAAQGRVMMSMAAEAAETYSAGQISVSARVTAQFAIAD